MREVNAGNGGRRKGKGEHMADHSIIIILIQFCSTGKQQKRETKAKTCLQYMNKWNYTKNPLPSTKPNLPTPYAIHASKAT